MITRIEVSDLSNALSTIKAGDEVLLSGIIYTARDAAHKRMIEMLSSNEAMPFPLSGQVIYYVGPCPEPEGKVIGSAGPTTSGRMDSYTPKLLQLGLLGMIGKGSRNSSVKEAIRSYGAVYFGTVGGAAALIARSIKESRVIAFPELGTEAVRRLVVKDFPAFVAIDKEGRDYYEIGRDEAYKRLNSTEP